MEKETVFSKFHNVLFHLILLLLGLEALGSNMCVFGSIVREFGWKPGMHHLLLWGLKPALLWLKSTLHVKHVAASCSCGACCGED